MVVGFARNIAAGGYMDFILCISFGKRPATHHVSTTPFVSDIDILTAKAGDTR